MSVTAPPDQVTKTAPSVSDDDLDLKILLPVMLGDEAALPDGFDRESYLEALDNLDLTEEEKDQIIAACYQLCETVIAHRFGVDPETIAQDRKRENLAKASHAMVSSTSATRDVFKTAAKLPQDKNRKKGA